MSNSYELTECSDDGDNDGDGVNNCADPQCWYRGECLPWWDDEGRKRAGPAPIPGGWDPTGCGVVQKEDAPLMALPFLWLWFRRRGSRKA
jgi:hypothetical protein